MWKWDTHKDEIKRQIKQTLLLVVGVLCIIFGIIGLVLPFLQGFLLIAVGCILLSLWSPKMRRWMDDHTKKYPKLHKIIKKMESWVVRIIGEPIARESKPLS